VDPHSSLLSPFWNRYSILDSSCSFCRINCKHDCSFKATWIVVAGKFCWETSNSYRIYWRFVACHYSICFLRGSSFVRSIIIFFSKHHAAQFLLVLLRSITQCEGHLSRSREDTAVLGKYYAFQIINIFLGSILAGTVFRYVILGCSFNCLTNFCNSILSQLVDLVLSPGEIVELLALHLPQQANFFVTYIAVNSIIRHLMALLRPVDLVLTIIRLKFAKSSRKRRYVHCRSIQCR